MALAREIIKILCAQCSEQSVECVSEQVCELLLVDATVARSGGGVGLTSCIGNLLLLMLKGFELVAEAGLGE